MFSNNLKIALRNMARNKTFAVINIAGLAVGIAVFILIFEFIAFEWNTNRFHKNFSSLYRIGTTDKMGNHDFFIAPGFMPIIKQKVPGISSIVRVTENLGAGAISITDEKTGKIQAVREENICYADSNFLTVFSFPLIAGSPALQSPNTLALSESMAKKLFGRTNITGRTVTINNQFGNTNYSVVAVFKDAPENSDIKPGILLSFSTLQNPASRNGNDWADPATVDNNFINCYLVIPNADNIKTISSNITAQVHAAQPLTADYTIILQPFSALHLAPGFSYPYRTFGSLALVSVLFAVAVLILMIAWVNYVNLSTVQALKRSRETGVRKVIGASRTQLAIQYLTETFTITACAVAFSFVLVQLLQNSFNSFTEKTLSLQILNHGWFWAATVLFILFGSLLSGGYVAFVLSSFNPLIAIRGGQKNKNSNVFLRKGLVVFQFSISIAFIISTMILYRQLGFMQQTDLGINLKQLLVIKGPVIAGNDRTQQSIAFKNELTKLSFVKKIAASNDVPGRGYNYSANGITRVTPQKNDEKKSYQIFIADNNFFDVYAIKFASGAAFSALDVTPGASKPRRVILNEKAAAQLGFDNKSDLTGQKINWAGTKYEIAGIVKDYHHLSLQTGIEPTIFVPSPSSYFYTVQTDFSNMPAKIEAASKLYQLYFPGNPFEYFFADEAYNQQYASEQRLGKVFISAAFIAIFIACLGLFGLASFTAQQRTKEIGIRKVLGASVSLITGLLVIDFVKLVFLSILIATPIAWWAAHEWLQNFAYRTSISWWIFIAAGITASLIAIATISFQAIRAAHANPVKSLRNE